MSVVPFKPAEISLAHKKENPAACVFVASLNRNSKDAELRSSVLEHFLKWGPISSVKVFKDWLKRPYAFVQYESVNDCKRAIAEAQSTSINGRRIRCEPARVNRSICLVTLNQPFNKKYVANVLSRYGEIEDMNILQPHGKFHSIMIKFKFRDDAIKAFTDLKSSKNNILNESSYQQWFVEWAAYLSNDNVYGVCGAACRLDKHTLFIGNLPDSVTEEDLFVKFTRYGHILDIHVVRKPMNRATFRKVFAFIKYQGEKETAEAIEAENGILFKEKVIRVCYRQYPCNDQDYDHYRYQQPYKFFKMNNPALGNMNNASLPYAGYNSNNKISSKNIANITNTNNNNNKALDNMTQAYGYNNNIFPTPPSNGYYVDPYPTMVYYTYTPYNNPYNNIHTTLVKNVGTNKHHESDATTSTTPY